MATENRQQQRQQGRDGNDQQQTRRRPLLDSRKKELMMAILLRNPTAFEAMRDALTPETFGRYDRGYSVAWQLTKDFVDEHGHMPDKEFLLAEIEDACNANPNTLNASEQDEVQTFLDFAFDPTSFNMPVAESTSASNFAVKTAKHFMEERLAARAKELMLDNNRVVVDMPDLMNTLQAEAELIAAITSDDIAYSFPDAWDQRAAIQTFQTNVSFIDKFLGGGHAPGEVYGLLGPYGSCKTTLVAQLAVEAAKYFRDLAKREDYDGRPTLAFIVSYEARLAEMRNRTLGYGARIQRQTLENMTRLSDDLSRAENLKPYEKKMFRHDIKAQKHVPGEFERAAQLIPVLNNHLVLLDMTGHERKGVGGGGVQEIANRISHECRKRNARCGVVFVDYVGAMVRRQMDSQNIPTDQLRHYIGGAGIKFKSKVADPFNCPVWLLHQLNADSNGKGVAVEMKHTDAAEAKNFAENLDFCFQVGVPDKVDQVALFNCSKHRRQPPKSNSIIKIDGSMNRVLCVDHLYVLNTHMKRIVRIDDNKRVPAAVQATPATANVTESESDIG